jgi:hypothetical protein
MAMEHAPQPRAARRATTEMIVFGWVVHVFASKHLRLGMEFLVHFMEVSSEVVDISLLKKNKHIHRRFKSCTPTTLKMV